MESPYREVLKLKEKMKEFIPKYEPLLGLDNLRYTRNLGNSASGMVLAKSEFNGTPIFVKIFPTVCNYKQIRKSNGELLKLRKEQKFDTNLLEIGITNLLSNFLFNSTPFTQNLVALYSTMSSDYGYEIEKSKCSCGIIPIDNNFIVSKERTGYPHEVLMSRYLNGELSDRVNVMYVENCSGDIENYLKSIFYDYRNSLINHHQLDRLMNSIFLQIILTLKCLDKIFNPFKHSDFGCRNCLITQTNTKVYQDNTYFKYIVDGVEYNIENVNVIPKIWDMSNVYLTEEQGSILKDSGLFSYLREGDEMKTCTTEIIPNMSQFCESIIKLPEFEFIKNTLFAEKLKLIVEIYDDNWDDFISIFDIYKVTECKILLEPIFTDYFI